MTKFYVVVYDPDGKNKSTWVPESWVYPKSDDVSFGTRKYVYYCDNRESPVPSYDILATLIQDKFKTKEQGNVYSATILGYFGE